METSKKEQVWLYPGVRWLVSVKLAPIFSFSNYCMCFLWLPFVIIRTEFNIASRLVSIHCLLIYVVAEARSFAQSFACIDIWQLSTDYARWLWKQQTSLYIRLLRYAREPWLRRPTCILMNITRPTWDFLSASVINSPWSVAASVLHLPLQPFTALDGTRRWLRIAISAYPTCGIRRPRYRGESPSEYRQ